MQTAKLLHQNFSSAHGHLTAGDPCLQILSVMLNTTSVNLSYKTPKSQRAINFDIDFKKSIARMLSVLQHALKIFKCLLSLDYLSF